MSKLKTITVGFTFRARPLCLRFPRFPWSDFEQQLRAVAEASKLTPHAIRELRRCIEAASKTRAVKPKS